MNPPNLWKFSSLAGRFFIPATYRHLQRKYLWSTSYTGAMTRAPVTGSRPTVSSVLMQDLCCTREPLTSPRAQTYLRRRLNLLPPPRQKDVQPPTQLTASLLVQASSFAPTVRPQWRTPYLGVLLYMIEYCAVFSYPFLSTTFPMTPSSSLEGGLSAMYVLLDNRTLHSLYHQPYRHLLDFASRSSPQSVSHSFHCRDVDNDTPSTPASHLPSTAAAPLSTMEPPPLPPAFPLSSTSRSSVTPPLPVIQPSVHEHVDETFPLEYTCDMLRGLRKVYEDRRGSIPERFVRHFKFPYIRSTFYDARTVWTSVEPEVAAEIERAGRTENGRWSLMVERWRQQKATASTPKSSTRCLSTSTKSSSS